MREVPHHTPLALLPGLLLLCAVDLDARDADQVLQIVVARLLAQTLVLLVKVSERWRGRGVQRIRRGKCESICKYE